MNRRMTASALALLLSLTLLSTGARAWSLFGRSEERSRGADQLSPPAAADSIEKDTAVLEGQVRCGQKLVFRAEEESFLKASAAGSVTYIWQRCPADDYSGENPVWTDIPDAVEADYILSEADLGCYIRVSARADGDHDVNLSAETTGPVEKVPYSGLKPMASVCASPTDLTITASIEPDQEYIVVPYSGESQPDISRWMNAYSSDQDDWHRFKGLRADTDYAVWTRFPEAALTASSWAVSTLFRTEPVNCPFEDTVENAWYAEAVTYVYGNALMSGTGETHFNPAGAALRDMVVAALWRLEGEPACAGSAFPDVQAGTWYAEAVTWAAENDLVTGYDDGAFKPTAAVTREQMAVILGRYARYKGRTVTGKLDLSSYADSGEIQSYALEDLRWCVEREIITGVDEHRLDPAGNTTRAQLAAMLMRFTDGE